MKVIRVLLPLFILMVSVSTVLAGQATYCISGNSTGDGWSFGVATWNSSVDSVYQTASCPGVPAGQGCDSLAKKFAVWVDGMESDDPTAAVDPENPCCFTITSTYEHVALFVGPSGGGEPNCEVTETGCEFNPLIVRLPASKVPTLGEWGLIVLAVLLAAVGWMFIRRRSRVTAAT